MYRLKITAGAEKELKQISKQYQRNSIVEAFKEIKENPFIGKPLTRDLTGKFSLKVGVYRIIYTIDQKDKIIRVLNAGHRANIYQ